MGKKFLREPEQVFDDGLYPSSGGLGQPEDIRHQALQEVLCRIPQHDYEQLKASIDSFQYFIPHIKSRGEVYPFPVTQEGYKLHGTEMQLKPYAKVLFLSPVLEQTDYDIVLAVTAHELAHIVLQHSVYSRGEEHGKQEDEAWVLIRKWSFEEEYKKHQLEQRQN